MVRLRAIPVWVAVALGTLGAARAAPATAQVVEARPRPMVTLDPVTGAFDAPLPFDEPFYIRIKLPERVDSTALVVGRLETVTTDLPGGGFRTEVRLVAADSIRLRLPHAYATDTGQFSIERHMRHDRDYGLRFYVYASPDSGPVADTMLLRVRPTAGFRERLDLDMGVFGAPRVGFVGVGIGARLHLAPLNKNASWRDTAYSPWRRALSLYAAVVPFEVHHEKPYEKLTGAGSIMTGVGFRIPGAPMTVSAGGLFFNQTDPHPLVTGAEAKVDFCVALTADLALKELVAPFVGLLGI